MPQVKERCSKVGGAKGNKAHLASRLENVLALVQQRMHSCEEDGADGGEDGDEDELQLEDEFELHRPMPRQVLLEARPGEMPENANIDSAQAESSVGFVLADDLDEEAEDDIEADIIAEKEAMRGCEVNPADAPYACLAHTEYSMDTVFLQRKMSLGYCCRHVVHFS